MGTVSGFSTNNNHGGFFLIFEKIVKKNCQITMVTVKGSLLFLVVTTSVFLITAPLHSVQAQNTGYQLIGPGACRGQNWGDGEWPVAAGDKTLEGCSKKCHEIEICTSFSLGKGEKAKKPCMLYSHEDIQPASSLGGECYKIAAGNDVDKKEQEVKTPPKPKKEKKVKKPKPENPAPEKKEEVKPEVKKPEVKTPEAKPEAKKPEKKPEEKKPEVKKPVEKPVEKKEPEVKTPQEKKTKKTEKPTEKPKETPPPVKKEKSSEKKEKAPENKEKASEKSPE